VSRWWAHSRSGRPVGRNHQASIAIIAAGTRANPIVQSSTPDLKTNKKNSIEADPETLRTSNEGPAEAGATPGMAWPVVAGAANGSVLIFAYDRVDEASGHVDRVFLDPRMLVTRRRIARQTAAAH
jgi:hypothetical protein